MEKKVFASEVALAMGVMINALAVSLMIKSELGVSTISSVPVVLNKLFSEVTIGSWNFAFQVVLVVLMAVITRKFLGYVLSVVLALLFGNLMDFFEVLFSGIIATMPLRIVFFFAGFFLLAFGISLMMNCKLPALPFDLFVREMADHFGLSVKQMKTGFDVFCVVLSVVFSVLFLEGIAGVGIGTVFAMLFTGTVAQLFMEWLNKRFVFRRMLVLDRERA
ncbi:putative membrane protein YczE [Trichococcus patagoniensis]|uniref:Putative membrane protein YczE n=1 Tax=Trichococcus patagoniensis TaxID=382641 RepID=A0A2T5IDT4_9LACT|nr:DUF6198 family protein [Trichococcus patagoniensis]PTQ81986.1 putative membrane protein YczE [Trichococcus patagoniensis]